MSASKHRSLSRRIAVLRRAVLNDEHGGILFHREGGMAMGNPDVKRLVREGLLSFHRVSRRSNKPLSPKRFVGNFRRDYGHHVIPANEQAPGCRPTYPVERGGHLHGSVNITRGRITDAGREFLVKYAKHEECDERDDPFY